MENDTIAAIATPVGSSGIGIVRISGAQAVDVSKRLFITQQDPLTKDVKKFFENIQSHRLYHGYIQDPINGGIVDEVLFVLMKSPKSYTREDVVEIQSHSGSVILSKILQLTLESGCRLAEPGEFTKRAFLNGRIDLSQAESIADMISANTEAGLKLAATHLTGGLKDKVFQFIDYITRAQIELEADIEFQDDINSHIDRSKMAETLSNRVLDPISKLLKQYDDGHVLREGIRLDIVGRPNVGKSSLLNALIKKDKAIVTHLPGTTRDLIEDYISIDGIPIVLTDTAGLHNTKDPVEKIGIEKTKSNIQKSDLVLWVVDGWDGWSREDDAVYEQITQRKLLLVINKIDLIDNGTEPQIPSIYQHLDRVLVSAKFGNGLVNLKGDIRKKCLNEVVIAPGQSVVPNLRQKTALSEALELISQGINGLLNHITQELVVEDLTKAKEVLENIIGRNVRSDVLDEIFAQFCIGK